MYNNRKGFIISLEPALSLLMFLLLITFLMKNFYVPYQEYSETIRIMHQTDLWLVNDSIYYYNQPQLIQKYEWVKNEINS